MPTDHSEYLQRIKPLIKEVEDATAEYSHQSWDVLTSDRGLTGEEQELMRLNYALATQRYYAANEALNAARAEYICSQQPIEDMDGL